MTTRTSATASAAGGVSATRSDPPWLLLAVLVSIYACAFVDRNVLSLLVEPIKRTLAVGDMAMSVLLGLAFALFYGLLAFPAGSMVDRYGRRTVIAVAATSWSVMSIVCGLSTTYSQLFVGRLGVGVAEAFITPAAFALIRERIAPDRQGAAFSFLAMGPFIGGAISLSGGGALFAAAKAGSFGGWPLFGDLAAWQVVLVAIGALGLPLPLLLLLLAPDRRVQYADAARSSLGYGDTLRYVARHVRAYGLLALYVTLGSMIAFGTSAWFPTIMSRRFDLPLPAIGLTSGPIQLVSAITGLLTCAWFLNRLSIAGRSPLVYGMIALAVPMAGAVGLAITRNPMLSWLLYAAIVFFSGAFYSVGATMLSRFSPAPLMGRMSALYLLCQAIIGAGAGPTLVALAAKPFSGPSAIASGYACYVVATGAAGIIVAILLATAKFETADDLGPEGSRA